MYKRAEHRLKQLLDSAEENILEGRQIGVEKESLRVTADGSISQKPHPVSLGSALTNPYITTDYSESLMEFITPPFDHIENVLEFLRDTQTFVYGKLQDEILWATSMPCVVAGDESIPLAQYGRSNAGMMKTVYRRGLGHRYGRVMQVIAGVHFNYSFPERFWRIYRDLEADDRPLQEFISDNYFAMIRNLQRYGWMVPYLFGASPAVCKSFLGGKESSLEEFDQYTYYGPYATSLRMGDIGYQNNKENEIGVKACYRNLDAYIKTLSQAIETPYPGYEKFGLKVGNEYQQLNTNILQIENEYYSTVRPKQILQGNEKPTMALKRRGVRYVELRSLDVNAYEPLGINETQLRFLEAFMVFCLLQESPDISLIEREAIDRNELEVAHRGRDPMLRLHRNGGECKLKDWALEVCDNMQGICELLDKSREGSPYTHALHSQINKINDPELTPSAIMLREMRERGEGFYHFARRMSQHHYDYFKSVSLSEEQSNIFAEVVKKSLLQQQALEAGDGISFDDYLKNYFSQC